jgi:hypothetical protein
MLWCATVPVGPSLLVRGEVRDFAGVWSGRSFTIGIRGCHGWVWPIVGPNQPATGAPLGTNRGISLLWARPLV